MQTFIFVYTIRQESSVEVENVQCNLIWSKKSPAWEIEKETLCLKIHSSCKGRYRMSLDSLISGWDFFITLKKNLLWKIPMPSCYCFPLLYSNTLYKHYFVTKNFRILCTDKWAVNLSSSELIKLKNQQQERLPIEKHHKTGGI